MAELDPETSPPQNWKPTRKWIASFTAAVGSVIASWIVTGSFDDVERGMVGSAIVALTASYWTTNEKTPSASKEH